MTNFAAKIAGVATLALAALPAVALTTAAHASPAPARIRLADIDLATASGRATFDARVQRAGETMCLSHRPLAAHEACMQGVRAEAKDRLAAAVAQAHLEATTAIAAR